jgi:hypothetical protein
MALFKKIPTMAPDISRPAAPRVEWELTQLAGRLRDAAPPLEAKDVEGVLVHARLADHYRDIGLAPPDPEIFELQSCDLDAEGWRRLALAVAVLDDTPLRAVLAALAPLVPVASQVESGFLGLARDVAPLTVALVRQNAIRAEEFARQFAARLGVAIAGETREESRRRLHALDYKRLLAEAEQAKQAARQKMERLRQQQSQADQRRRRGKW